MKKFYTLSLLLLSSFGFAQASNGFTATPPAALNANGWSTHSGTGGQIVTSTGSLTYAGLTSTGNKTQIVAGNSEDINLASASPITTAMGTAYYSGLINVLNTTLLSPNSDLIGNYFLMLGTTSGATVTVFNARIYIKAGSVANTFNLGILNNSGVPTTTPATTVTPTFSTTDFPIGTTLFLVTKFNFATNTASLFVNPTIGGTEGTATITNATGITAAPAQFLSLAIRQAGTTSFTNGNIEIDEVRIGSTWGYVTAASLSVKQNAISGLNMYPNPVKNGNLYITSNSSEAKSVEIYDILGKQVLNAKVSNNTVNVSNLQGGAYIVKINEEGKTATRKLIIE